MNNTIKRACGLLIIEVINSNPNGDPDRDSDPRQRPDRLGEISPVSYKRKLRDIVEVKKPEVWNAVQTRLSERDLKIEDTNCHILERRGRERRDIINEILAGTFDEKYWDARLFGNTFLESREKMDKDFGRKLSDKEWEKLRRNIKTGFVQFGMGISTKPIEIRRNTETNKAGVGDVDKAGAEKQQGMAPLGCRFVVHGIYTMPFFVNPNTNQYPFASDEQRAQINSLLAIDLELMLQLIPAAYPLTASKIRPMVAVKRAHFIEHTSALGSFPDFEVQQKLGGEENIEHWSKDAAINFLKSGQTPYKFARYRELVSDLELRPDDVK